MQEVKKKCRHTVSLTTGQDYNPPKSKQHKNVPSKSTLAKPVESKPDGESNDSMDADSILIQVQDSINKWVQCQVKDKLKNICENKHYSIRVGDSANVYVACLLCDKTIKLQQKNNGTYQTSNWFKHIKRCIEIKRSHQPKLKFSSKLSSTPLKSSSKDHDMSSSKDDKLLEIPATQVTYTTNLSSDERKKSSMLMEDIAIVLQLQQMEWKETQMYWVILCLALVVPKIQKVKIQVHWMAMKVATRFFSKAPP